MNLVVFPPMPRSTAAFARVMSIVTEGVPSVGRLALVAEAYRGALPGTRWQLTFLGPSGMVYRQVVALEDERYLYVFRLDACASARPRAQGRMVELCSVRPSPGRRAA